MLDTLFPYFEIISAIISVILLKNYKRLDYYKYFVLYLVITVLFERVGAYFKENWYIFDVYMFFEFNLLVIIYYKLVNETNSRKLIKYLAIAFNILYFTSFYFMKLKNYTVIIESFICGVFVINYFRELLNSDKILSYKKLLSFWISVGFLMFYIATIPFFTLLYTGVLKTKAEFYILHSAIILMHICFIFGLLWCRKKTV